MRRSAEHEAQGIFVAEGEKVTRRLLESHFTVVSIVLPEKHLEKFCPLLEARPEQVTVYLVEKPLLETLVGYSLFQGVLSVGKIPPPASLSEVLQKNQRPQLFVAIDELSNAENLGALVRNCVAFGVHGLIVGETSSSPFLRRAVRNSMGAIFQLPVLELKEITLRSVSYTHLDVYKRQICVRQIHHPRQRFLRQLRLHRDRRSPHPRGCLLYTSRKNLLAQREQRAQKSNERNDQTEIRRQPQRHGGK